MKRFLLLLGFLVVLSTVSFSCKQTPEQQRKSAERKEQREREQKAREAVYNAGKVVSAKDAPIENRFSATDYFWGEGSVTKSTTVYYLYSEDGYSLEVDRKVYHQTKIGDRVKGHWQ